MDAPPQTALITGANSGIGLATTIRLLNSGIQVLAHTRSDKHNLELIENEFLTILSADLSSASALHNLLGEISHYNIDILINNAAHFNDRQDFLAIRPKEIDLIFAVNLTAVVQLIQAVLPGMIAQSWGRIINISSVSVTHGGAAATLDYTCTKSSLESLTRSLAKEYTKYNILINAIRAGFTDTKFHQQNSTKNLKSRADLIPLKRPAQPDEIASAVEFLCTDASSFVSGAILPVTGGELS